MTIAGLSIMLFIFVLVAIILLSGWEKQTGKKRGGIHIKPMKTLRSQYDGWFTNTNKCKNCGSIGCTFNLHIAKPCPVCGGTVEISRPRIWNNKTGTWQTKLEAQDDINKQRPAF